MLTERLEVRLPTESDRVRFVELFGDERFMEFSMGVLDPDAAHRRFDGMLATAAELPFAKQPVVERSTGVVVGYAGVDWFDFEGSRRLEFGYRLVPGVRGRGYATEACQAVLDIAATTYRGEILAFIDPTNPPVAERGPEGRVHLLEASRRRRLPRQPLPPPGRSKVRTPLPTRPAG